MKLFNNRLFFVLSIFICFNSFGQEEFIPEQDETFYHHSVAILINHTTLFGVVSDGDKTAVTVPSWAINYNYAFNEKWALGLHSDIIIEKFIIEENSGGDSIEREIPISSLIVGTYKIIKGLGLELGIGMEFEKNENFAVARIGAEYGLEIPKHKLEVLFGVDYDIIFNAYNSFNIGFGIAKLF